MRNNENNQYEVFFITSVSLIRCQKCIAKMYSKMITRSCTRSHDHTYVRITLHNNQF